MHGLSMTEKIIPVCIEEEMKQSYMAYSMSVIIGRALPDVRDGLKPVHRRVLFAMDELNLDYGKPYKKCARIVGEVLGKFHPHGDTAVYDTLVRMVQEFSLRFPLVDGQGNFGSIDGDSAAAMRYTEARMSAISKEMLVDINKNTVNLVPNFDGSLKEPVVLPASFPNLLINGSTGIAVGMATNMPPHNLGEVCSGVMALLENQDITIKGLMKFIKGPDFPTAGILCGKEGINKAYETGRGKLLIRARANIEHHKNSKESIIISELPYQVNKANLIKSMADLVTGKKLEGISDIRDESDKDGIRVVIELKRDAQPEIVLNYLYKHTQLETTFGIINLAIVNNGPKVLTLKEILLEFVGHRRNVIKRRTQFDLDKAIRRAHILEGLRVAIDKITEIIKTIRESKSTQQAKVSLMTKFGLSEIQAQAILEMQLQRLTALERGKIENEYNELLKAIDEYRIILESPEKVDQIIRGELIDIKKKYDNPRRTEIASKPDEIEMEDLIVEEDMAITITNTGYIKRMAASTYRKQRRGGVGVTGMSTKDADFVKQLFVASSKDYLLIFSTKGIVRWLKVYEIPMATRNARGKNIVNLLSFSNDEQISTIVSVKEFSDNEFVVMATVSGNIKKTKLSAFGNPRKGGIVGITLEKKDFLIETVISSGKNDIFLATKDGKSIRFNEKGVRAMGRLAKGVRGISLKKGDGVVSMVVFSADVGKTGCTLLTVTEKGYAKRSNFDAYRTQTRGGKGVINVKVTEKNGCVVGTLPIMPKDEIMSVTKNGMVIRCGSKEIRQTGRSAVGVRMVNLRSVDKVSSIANVIAKSED